MDPGERSWNVVVPAVPRRSTDARVDVATRAGAGRDFPRREHAGRRAEGPSFLEDFGITFPSGRDPDGRIAIDYGVWGLPEAIIVDPAGRITYKHIGTIGAVQLAEKLDEARRGAVSTTQGRGDYESTR